jgi:DNA polymerase epsilon subunit 3
MPPKKSEQPRRSDVSTARFEVMEEDAPARPGPSTEDSQPSASVITGSSFVVADGKTASASGTSPGHEEKKDKEVEKKDKTDKDAVTIEVG